MLTNIIQILEEAEQHEVQLFERALEVEALFVGILGFTPFLALALLAGAAIVSLLAFRFHHEGDDRLVLHLLHVQGLICVGRLMLAHVALLAACRLGISYTQRFKSLLYLLKNGDNKCN